MRRGRFDVHRERSRVAAESLRAGEFQVHALINHAEVTEHGSVTEPGDFRRPFLILWAIFIVFYFSELAGFSLSSP